jgi:hypothetical protein
VLPVETKSVVGRMRVGVGVKDTIKSGFKRKPGIEVLCGSNLTRHGRNQTGEYKSNVQSQKVKSWPRFKMSCGAA